MLQSWFGLCVCCAEDAENGKIGEEVAVQEGINSHSEEFVEQPKATNIWEAAEYGDMKLLESLLGAKADVNEAMPDGPLHAKNMTPLIAAAKGSQLKTLQRLLEEPDIDLNATTTDEEVSSRSGQTALHWAARALSADCARALLKDSRVNKEAKTQFGFTPLMVASQDSNAKTVIPYLEAKCDANAEIKVRGKIRAAPLALAINNGLPDVVVELCKCGQIDLNEQFGHIHAERTCALDLAVTQKLPNVVRTLLEYGARPDLEDEKGMRPIERGVDGNAVEIVMVLMLTGADTSRIFSNLRRLQVLGDSAAIRQAVAANQVTDADELPELHKAVFKNDLQAVKKEIASAGADQGKLLDSGHLPAIYYAIELGFLPIIEELLLNVYAIGNKVTQAVLKALKPIDGVPVMKLDSSRKTANGEKQILVGTRFIKATLAVLDKEQNIVETKSLAKGCFSVISPFCGSVAALNYFQACESDFDLLRKECEDRCFEIYSPIDAKTPKETLGVLFQVGKNESHGSHRQDNGFLPVFRYYLNEAGKQSMGGNHEVFATRTLALVAMSLQEVFEEDMKKLFKPYAEEVKIAPPKTFQRMMNKLLNPKEHGDPTLTKPRSMKNIDVLRLGAIFDDANRVVEAYNALKSKYRIVRVKNTNDPNGSGFGGYRSILVNFAYESGVKFKDLYGDTGTGRGGDVNVQDLKDKFGQMWHTYAKTLGRSLDCKWCLMPLWYSARQEPEREICIVGEVQMIYAPYMKGRELSHLLYKIARCETGPAEMVRDFAAESFKKPSKEDKEALAAVASLALKIRRGEVANEPGVTSAGT